MKKKRIYTEYLNYNTASNILHAFDFAKSIAMPLNFMITINFYDDVDATEKFKVIRKLYREWISAKRKTTVTASYLNPWVYVFENPHQNNHVHWVVHIEKQYRSELRLKIKEWVAQNSIETKKNQVDFQDINIFEDKVVANYLVKGVNYDACVRLNLQHYKKYQGFVKGQRARVAICIGRTARKRANFNPRRDRNNWVTDHPHLMEGHARPPEWDIALTKRTDRPRKGTYRRPFVKYSRRRLEKLSNTPLGQMLGVPLLLEQTRNR
ncbi:hypothetical protein [Agrobacterium larrymoorei]|uniref:Uncharacterized protein n=1 Tax=Agrobacterium larrymoorei TaxID=160699 RepID=A0AAF0HCC8_9HYPH|nr:hypothetical protein [Agrobacterium larrymoorei]WHA41925.1 hypothetical protein CFBP5477_004655 [Agrobacterium larrymoorei]